MNTYNLIVEEILEWYDFPLARIVKDGTTGKRFFELFKDCNPDKEFHFYVPFDDSGGPFSLEDFSFESLDPRRTIEIETVKSNGRKTMKLVDDVGSVVYALECYFDPPG